MANEGSTRMTPEELRAMARNARAPVTTTAELRVAIESGEQVASTGSRV